MNDKRFQNALARVGFLLFISIGIVLVSCAGLQPRVGRLPETKNRPTVHGPELEREIHVLINKERRSHGLPVLAWEKSLTDIARQHSHDMAKRNYFSHYSPEGHDFSYRYKQQGFTCGVLVGRMISLGGENLALNHLFDSVTMVNGVATYYDWNSQQKIAVVTVQGWMKSPGHRKNILTPYFKSEGIGAFITPDGNVYITQNFC
jgi:uncharacterized protein YkwD